MKFSCEKALLQTAVNTASRAVSSKSSISALEGLLLTCDQHLTISGYNMQTGIRTFIDAEIVETGALILNARLFSDMIRNLPDDILVLESNEKLNVTITCGDAFYEIQGISPEDYPDLPEVEEDYSVSVQQKLLRTMIAQTSFAISTNEARPVHTGSLFEIDDQGLTLVSVDGFRLALRHEKIEAFRGGAFRFVAPGSALNEVEKICEDSEEQAVITLGNRHLLFEVGNTQLICRRLEGDFLDYKTAIPRNNPTIIRTEKRAMMQSIERVSVVINEKQKSPIRCIFDEDAVYLSTRTANGEAKDICRVKGDGGKLEIGFNHRYLLEALKYAPADELQIELNTGISPCIITPTGGEENFLYMVLPVRLKKE